MFPARLYGQPRFPRGHTIMNAYHKIGTIALLTSIIGCALEPMRVPADAGTDSGAAAEGGPWVPGCSDTNPCAPSENPCWVPTCQFDGSCSYDIPAPEGDACNGKDVCDGHGSCVTAGPPCKSSSDCDDKDPCTGDVCFDGSLTCGHYLMPACVPKDCVQPSDCDDGNPCTLDICHTFSGKCFNPVAMDGDQCPGGFCTNGACVPN